MISSAYPLDCRAVFNYSLQRHFFVHLVGTDLVEKRAGGGVIANYPAPNNPKIMGSGNYDNYAPIPIVKDKRKYYVIFDDNNGTQNNAVPIALLFHHPY